MEKEFAVFDLKAYYASFECVERGLDPFTTPLVVSDITRKESTIVLSVTPYLKNLGVPSRCRRRELPDIEGMIYATPQMEKYVKRSADIVEIFLDYFGIDDNKYFEKALKTYVDDFLERYKRDYDLIDRKTLPLLMERYKSTFDLKIEPVIEHHNQVIQMRVWPN